jgi:hypothetical protein
MITKNLLISFLKSEENIKFLDINDNKMYDLFNIVNFNDERYSTDGVICTLYYFNKDRPFIIIQGYAYGLLLYYYDINSMNLILLNEQKNGAENYYVYDSLYNTSFFDAINNRDSIITDKKFKKNIYCLIVLDILVMVILSCMDCLIY